MAMEFPAAGALVHEAPEHYGLRWMLLRNLPMQVGVRGPPRVRDDALVIVAVFHARRRPGYWLERLRQVSRKT